MKYIVILMTIVVYGFVMGILTSALLEDTLLVSPEYNSSDYSRLNVSQINYSSTDDTENPQSISRWKESLNFLFGFKVSSNLEMPQIVKSLIAFINWFAVILVFICLYKIGNPLSSA